MFVVLMISSDDMRRKNTCYLLMHVLNLTVIRWIWLPVMLMLFRWRLPSAPTFSFLITGT